jgi:hypothetical protein
MMLNAPFHKASLLDEGSELHLLALKDSRTIWKTTLQLLPKGRRDIKTASCFCAATD